MPRWPRMSERFGQFQQAFSEETCLALLMRARHGGASMACPACGRASDFALRPKLRAFACPHCNYLVHPASGTALESRRTPLQLWFFAMRVVAESGDKRAAGVIEREAGVPGVTARRLVEDLATLAEKQGEGGWFATLRGMVGGGACANPTRPVASAVAAEPPAIARPSTAPVAAPGQSPVFKPQKADEPVSSPAPARSQPEPASPRPTGRSRRSGGLMLAGIALGIGAVAAAVLGIAVTRMQPEEKAPELAEARAVAVPSLETRARPSLIISSVESDLEAARQAAQFALDNDPALAALKPQAEGEDASQPQIPVTQLQMPSNILLVPPKLPSGQTAAAPPRSQVPQAPIAAGGDPEQILTFGPIRIRRHLVDTIVRAGKTVGADPTLLMAVADKESSFSTSVKAQTSSATGLYQFIEQTWLGVVYEFGARHGMAAEAKLIVKNGRRFAIADAAERQRILDLRREPYLSALLAAEMLKRDTLRLEKAMGRHLTGGEIYLIHFLGPDAAQTFIETMEETPGVKAAELLPTPAAANRPIFYAEAGGETKTLSVSEVHKKFNDMIKVRLDRYSAVRPNAGQAANRPPPKR